MKTKFGLLGVLVFLGALLPGLIAKPLPPMPPAPSPTRDLTQRPKLIGNRLLQRENNILNAKYEYFQAELEFDQDLYINEPFVCGGAEKDCVRQYPGCVPCDWSDPKTNPAPGEEFSCEDPQCCGPATGISGSARTVQDLWCQNTSDSGVPFETIQLNQPSKTKRLSAGEMSFYRFFVPEEMFCHALQVFVRPIYGSTTLFVSNLHAFPDLAAYDGDFRSIILEVDVSYFSYAQAAIHICPNSNVWYMPGTFSIGVTAGTETEFYVEVIAADDPYPLPDPPVRLSCADVPEEEFIIGQGNSSSNYVFCAEDGITKEINLPTTFSRDFVEIILPVPPGCHAISTIINMYTLGGTNHDADIYCLSKVPYERISEKEHVAAARWKGTDDYLFFAGCFDETVYIHCALNIFFVSGPFEFVWSTMAKPVRTLITDIHPTSLTLNQGLIAASGLIQGEVLSPCADYRTSCYSWIAPSSNDSLVFWPPPGDTEPISGPFDPIAPDLYASNGLSVPMSNRLVVLDFSIKAGTFVNTFEDKFEKGSLAIFTVTNEIGLPVELPNNGPVNAAGDRSFNHYIPNIAYPSLNLVAETSGDCVYESYSTVVDLISEQVAAGLEEFDLNSVIRRNYYSDIFGAGSANQACVDGAETLMEQISKEVTKRDITLCQYDVNEEPDFWNADPCCNFHILPVNCCFPFQLETEETVFSDPDTETIELSCGNDACIQSLTGDLADSLNTLDDPLSGCNSGIKSPSLESNYAIELQLQRGYRQCLDETGAGGLFQGVPCASDENCTAIGTTCDLLNEICRLPSLNDFENSFLNCYITKLTSNQEDYLRRKVLPNSLAESPRDSLEFFEAVKEASLEFDCVSPSDPLDLSFRTKSYYRRPCWSNFFYQYYFNYSFWETWAHVHEFRPSCPDLYCLGDTCRFPTYDCGNQWGNCRDEGLEVATEENCPVEVSACNTNAPVSSCDGSFVCAYCPETGPCIEAEGVTTEAECNQLKACYFPDNSMQIGVTEQQCLTVAGKCSEPCYGQSCRPAFAEYQKGVCQLDIPQDWLGCQRYGGGVYSGRPYGTNFPFVWSECLLTAVRTEQECLQIPDPTSWHTCGDLSVDECVPGNFGVPQLWLKCFVDQIRDCETPEECVNSGGGCSDQRWNRRITDWDPYNIQFNYGACHNSGFFDVTLVEKIPSCNPNPRGPIGCRNEDLEEGWVCAPFDIGTVSGNNMWEWNTWVSMATTEDECLGIGAEEPSGRNGCMIKLDTGYQRWWYNESECVCRGGIYENVYSWAPGVWQEQQTFPMTWMERTPQYTYEWQPSVSFFQLESWIKLAAEETFVDSIKSQMLCESNIVSSSLSSITCDCLAEDSPKDATCYGNTSVDIPVGVSGACEGEHSLIKGPSSIISFFPNSTADLCTKVSLALIYSSWFDDPAQEAKVSFQFEERKAAEAVRNKNDAIVGQLVGDGSKIAFDYPSRVISMEVCLAIKEEPSGKYNTQDFGYTTDYDFIYPMGYSEVEVRMLGSDLEYWCKNVTREDVPSNDEAVRLFPIYRYNNWKNRDEEYYSDSTVALVYTLAACYLLDMVLLILFILVLLYELRRTGKPVPIVAHIAFLLIILCIFRVAFCFLWPVGGFDGNQLAEYVVFEIPTFLLFTIVIMSIGFWRKLSRKSTFNFRETDKTLWMAVGLTIFLVWCLFAIVAIVYAEVVLEDSEVEKSQCPGRVADSNQELEDNTRKLSIIYQSIVIFFTFLFGALFWYSSYKLFKLTSKGVSSAKQFVFRIGAVIVLAFMLRCVLFIILLAADFTSAAYLFVTLMVTEVFMIFLVQLEFNKRFFSSMITGGSALLPTGMNLTTRSGSRMSSVMSSGTPSQEESVSGSGSLLEKDHDT